MQWNEISGFHAFPPVFVSSLLFSDIYSELDNYLIDEEGYSTAPAQMLDVPFVPTDEAVVEAMLRMGRVGPKDVLYDLGSGDGRILIAAAREQDTHGIGIDIDPQRIEDAVEYARWYEVDHLVEFIEGDIFEADFSEATVVTLYLLPSINVELRPQLLRQLKPGARIVSHAFDMGDWQPDEALKIGGTNIFKWTVPAKVSGTWEWQGADGTPYRIELQQKYQKVSGKAWKGESEVKLESAELSGNRLQLKLRAEDAPAPDCFMLTFADNKLRSIIAS